MASLGRFIVFEGIDGSGKTTQIELLALHMKAKGLPVLLTYEPTDGAIGTIARQATDGAVPLTGDTLALLFAADRAEHLARQISPALAAGTHVLCDRYIYSSMAYQGMHVYDLHKSFLLVPDMTIFIDTDPEETVRRISINRQNKSIFDDKITSVKIRANYLESFGRYKHGMPVTTINGNQSEDAVFNELLAVIDKISFR